MFPSWCFSSEHTNIQVFINAVPLCGVQGVEGELVWGQVEGLPLWPAIITALDEKNVPGMRMVEWYGQNMCSWVR